MMKHKWYVAIECFKMGLWLHAFTHDLSKLYPSEARAYAFHYDKRRSGKIKTKNEEEVVDFHYAWNLHQKRNPHHWNFWLIILDGEVKPLPMPEKYVKQLICDWKAVAQHKGRSTKEYYNSAKDRMMLHEETEELIEKYLEANK